MFFVFKFGNINIVVLFVIGELGVLEWVIFFIIVVLYCNGLLMIKFGCFFFVIWVVFFIFLMFVLELDVFVE